MLLRFWKVLVNSCLHKFDFHLIKALNSKADIDVFTARYQEVVDSYKNEDAAQRSSVKEFQLRAAKVDLETAIEVTVSDNN